MLDGACSKCGKPSGKFKFCWECYKESNLGYEHISYGSIGNKVENIPYVSISCPYCSSDDVGTIDSYRTYDAAPAHIDTYQCNDCEKTFRVDFSLIPTAIVEE